MINDSVRQVHIISDQPLVASHNYIVSLLRLLDKFKAVTGDVQQLSLQNRTGTVYAYSISAPGRSWDQNINIPGTEEASMTFDVPSYWKLSEFSRQREIRDTLIALVVEFGLKTATIQW